VARGTSTRTAKVHSSYPKWILKISTGSASARRPVSNNFDYATKKFNLDFDDAYQYAVAEKYDLTIVSFDVDFDRTERGRKTPGEVLEGRGSE